MLIQYHPGMIIGDGGGGADGSYDSSTKSLNVSEVDKDRMWYVTQRIANATNLGVGSPIARYPSDDGFCTLGFPEGLSFTGRLYSAAGVTVTLTVETTNDPTLGYWIPCTELFTLNNGVDVNTSIISSNQDLYFGLDITRRPANLYYRIPIAVAGVGNNAVILDLLQFAGV